MRFLKLTIATAALAALAWSSSPAFGTLTLVTRAPIPEGMQTPAAQQQDISNLFTEADPRATPEPSARFLIGTGLLCFGLTRKRRLNR
jgi:hypothetical protein